MDVNNKYYCIVATLALFIATSSQAETNGNNDPSASLSALIGMSAYDSDNTLMLGLSATQPLSQYFGINANIELAKHARFNNSYIISGGAYFELIKNFKIITNVAKHSQLGQGGQFGFVFGAPEHVIGVKITSSHFESYSVNSVAISYYF